MKKIKHATKLSMALSRYNTGRKPYSLVPIPYSLILALLFTINYSLTTTSCDLLNNKTDVLSVIDQEVAWAKADKLTVAVYPVEWGRSPQEGGCRDAKRTNEVPRLGYPFNVEFTPLPNYGFEQWLAFPSSADFDEWFLANKHRGSNDKIVTDRTLGGVSFADIPGDAGAKTAKRVTISTLEPVTLVPWCGDRPRVIQTNPPLIPSGITYPRGQDIRIVFSTELVFENGGAVPFGDGLIQITGTNVGDGSLLNGHGDLTGITDPSSCYFTMPTYNARIITVKPKEGLLPPANLNITVTVGTKIKGINGNELGSPAAFSYTTDDRQIIKAYRTNQIEALHPNANPETDFFYLMMTNKQFDRRIRTNDNGDYAVTLYFDVSPSNSSEDIMPPLPDTIDIVELEYATLNGSEMYNNVGIEKNRTTLNASDYVMENDAAGMIYQNTNKGGTGYYQVEYNWGKTPPDSGIRRLVVLPYRKGDGAVNDIDPQTVDGAVLQFRYVPVVFDREAPGGSAVMKLTGTASESGGVYNYNSDNMTININANFAGISDNVGYGIRKTASTMDRPWTMDDPADIRWRYRVNGITSGWFPLTENEKELEIASLGLSSSTAARDIQVQYRDSLGNENSWVPLAQFRYYDSARAVWAMPAGVTGNFANNFIYQSADLNRDRRLRKNGDGNYEVTIYYYVPGLSFSDNDRVRVTEIAYATLQGNERAIPAEPAFKDLTPGEVTGTGTTMDGVYKSGNLASNAAYYTVKYTWDERPADGIIRLVIMPYRTSDLSFTDTWQAAVSEGRYVTVVMDGSPPAGNANLAIGGDWASVSEGVYNFNPYQCYLTINANLSGITDNGGIGIPKSAATADKPWTMDNTTALKWRFRITTSVENYEYPYWMDLSENYWEDDLDGYLRKFTSIARNVQVQYKDGAGNASDWSASLGRIRYNNSAANVWAIHSGVTATSANDFFYQGADLNRDRRVKKNGSNYEVNIYFSIPSTDNASQPNRLRIAEINYATLQGNDVNTLIGSSNYREYTSLTKAEGATGTADAYYRTGKYGTFYRVTYTGDSTYLKTAGIIRLAIMPYRNDEGFSDTWQTAITEGRFVTVVVDNAAPTGGASMVLSGETVVSGGAYNFNPVQKSLTINASLSGVMDNGGIGIPKNAATQNKPWTMDNQADIKWRYRIARGATADYTSPDTDTGWFALSTYQQTVDLADVLKNANPIYTSAARDIQVQYKDGAGNPSDWSSSLGKIRYNNTATNVWAIHYGVTATGEANFFYQGADLSRDRRVKKNGSNYEVNIYFSIPSTDDLPDRLAIAEINYATLQGNDVNTLINTRAYTSLTKAEGATGTADAYYRSGKTGTFYKVTYTGDSTFLKTAGIIRLAVMPYRNSDGFNDDWQTAIAEGRYVTVVLDNVAPSGAASLSLSGETVVSGGAYNFNPVQKNLTINANLSAIADNAGIGIPKSAATQNKPWTMDNQADVKWRYQIVRGATADYTSPDTDTGWFALSAYQQTVDLANVLKNANPIYTSAARDIQVQYKDSMGNPSDWTSLGKIRYNNTAANIWAIHYGVTATSANDFFYQGAELSRDRRLKKNGSNYEVNIYFSIPSTDSASQPNTLRIAEIHYATLQGNDVNTLIGTPKDYAYTTNVSPTATQFIQASGSSGNDSWYKNGKSGTFYKVTYTGDSSCLKTAGIIRLALMPYRSTETFVDDWQVAIAEGRFVTVVLDNAAPGGAASFTLSDGVWKDGNVSVFNLAKPIFTLNGNLSGITDNSSVGIPKSAATQDKPWTMDDKAQLQWQYRIVKASDSTPDYPTDGTTTWISMNTATRDINLGTSPISLLSQSYERRIEVQYKDGMGNPSEWISTGQCFRYHNSATDVWAMPASVTADYASNFIYQSAPLSRDRRLRKNSSEKYEVTLYYYIPGGTYDRVDIVEIAYATLQGNENVIESPTTLKTTANISPTNVTSSTDAMDTAYRSGKTLPSGTACYSTKYTWTTAPANGIIRLVVMPHQGTTNPDTWQAAIAEGRFVTVVMENLAPDGIASFTLSGHSWLFGSNNTPLFTSTNPVLRITADFTGFSDNYVSGSANGIPPSGATADKPWTMDDRNGTRWQYRIVRGTAPTVDYTQETAGTWAALATTFQSLNLSSASLSPIFEDRRIQVRYRDGRENQTDWRETGQTFHYNNNTLTPVVTWSASYNENDNSITINWTTPTGNNNTPCADVTISGGVTVTKTYLETGAQTHTIFNVPHIVTSKVASGQPVENIVGYAVSITAYNNYGRAAPVTFKIWNIPEMSINQGAYAIEVIDQTSALDSTNKTVGFNNINLSATGVAKYYVLANDITVTGTWTPKGSNVNTNAFQGKFYGNGHTITFVSGSGFANATYTGIFGYISGAEIRDLRVHYAVDTTADASTAYLGGIAGYAASTAKITNCLVTGISTSSLAISSATASDRYLGGMVGQMNNAVVIDNGYVSVNVTLTHNAAATSYVGGVVGRIYDTLATLSPILRGITVTGNVTCTKSDEGGIIYAGGIVGSSSNNKVKLLRLSYGGTLSVARESNPAGTSSIYAGGIIGSCQYPRLEDCVFEQSANITIGGTSLGDRSSIKNIGGIAGYLFGYTHNDPEGSYSLSNCFARGNINLKSREGTVYAGGITGNLYGDNSITQLISMYNCVFEQGVISIQTAGETFVGGITGRAIRGAYFVDCHSRSITNGIKVSISSGALNFGGFSGYLTMSTLKNCDNSSPITMNENSGRTTGTVYMGGFAGRISIESNYPMTMENCWSIGNVSSLSSGQDLYTGGLIGTSHYSNIITYRNEIINCRADGNVSADNNYTGTGSFYTGGLVGNASYTNIKQSRAGGNVTATCSSASPAYAGGLTGYADYSAIENCYALGDVLAGKNAAGVAGNVYAGGLVGYILNTTVQYNFAAGSVTAQSNGTGTIAAGGIVGMPSTSCTTSNNAALGANVIAKGSGTNVRGRICSQNYGTINYNYALSTMLVGRGGTYGVPVVGSTVSSTDATTLNGKDTTLSQFRQTNFWIDEAGLAFNTNGTGGGLGNVTNVWNFNNVSGEGHPRLIWEKDIPVIGTGSPTVVFSEGFEGTSHSFTIVNGTQTNKWYVGTVVANGNTKSAYISNDNGTSNSYTNTATSVVHMYRDVTFPASTSPYTLTFAWKLQGENATSDYDFLRVFLTPISVTPVAGTELPTDTNTINYGTYRMSGNVWQGASISLPATNGMTRRLVFTWVNDASGGGQPPIALDDIILTR